MAPVDPDLPEAAAAHQLDARPVASEDLAHELVGAATAMAITCPSSSATRTSSSSEAMRRSPQLVGLRGKGIYHLTHI
jgi:hypothetical protein